MSLAIPTLAQEGDSAGALPEPVEILAGLGLPGANDENYETHSFTLLQYPGVDGVGFIADEDWCNWFVSWMVEDDPTAAQLEACHKGLRPFDGVPGVTVPETIATSIARRELLGE